MVKKSLVSVLLVLGSFAPVLTPAQAAEHVFNGDMKILGTTDVLRGIDAKARPAGWMPAGYGNNTRYYIYGDWAQHNGAPMKMVKVHISRYVDGNASWISNDMPVEGGKTYVLTHQYRSNVPSKLGVRYMINGVYTYRWLNTFPATNTFLQVPVRRRFTVPAGATRVAIYRSISSVGWLEFGGVSLVDPGDIKDPSGENLLRNGNLLEVDQNNEPVGWKHRSASGTFRGYKWQVCSRDRIDPPVGTLRPCPFERGSYISLSSPSESDDDASWLAQEVILPPQKTDAPRNLHFGYYVASGAEPRTKVLFTMADGSTLMRTIAIINTDGVDIWGGGGYLTATEVPKDAVKFTFYITRKGGDTPSVSKFAGFLGKLVDPGVPITGPFLGSDPDVTTGPTSRVAASVGSDASQAPNGESMILPNAASNVNIKIVQ